MLGVLLHLVRHGKPVIDPRLPPGEWTLDPTGLDAVETLREALPTSAQRAIWCCSSERKAIETAQHLTAAEVAIVPELREAERGSYLQDGAVFTDAVTRGLQDETTAALPEWEPLQRTRQRVRQAVDAIASRELGDVAFVGRGTAWTLLVADLLGEANPAAFPRMSMPDLLTIDLDQPRVVSPWGGWLDPSVRGPSLH